MARVLSGLRGLTVGAILLGSSASIAPFQCASQVDPDKRREEEPGEALYGLAEQFKAKGATGARVETLRYIVKRYPTSRFAQAARLDLESLSEPVPASGGEKGEETEKGAP
jgi:hypothetical protein